MQTKTEHTEKKSQFNDDQAKNIGLLLAQKEEEKSIKNTCFGSIAGNNFGCLNVKPYDKDKIMDVCKSWTQLNAYSKTINLMKRSCVVLSFNRYINFETTRKKKLFETT